MSVTVCIDGLSGLVSSSNLQELAAQYGVVQDARIVTAPGGGSLGFGYIEMASAAEAHALVTALKHTRFRASVTN